MRYKIFDVFADKPFEGNPTGVVYCDHDIGKKTMQAIASEISVPDTIFLLESNDPTLTFSSLAFSPYEELKICGQGIVGAMFSLLEDRNISEGLHEIETSLGRSQVFIEGAVKPIIYTSLGNPEITEVGTQIFLNILQDLNLASVIDIYSRTSIVDLGRIRLLIEVPSTILKSISVNPSDIMQVFKKFGINGIVFFSQDSGDKNTFRSRHFTTSLNGNEDAVTGGASGAIYAFAKSLNLVHSNSVIVHQGGFTTRDGYIFVKSVENNPEIFIGGRAVKTMEGQFYYG